VARYARELALAMGLSDYEADLAHTAGLLHDIGKFSFPDSILLAEQPLAAEHWDIVKRHPGDGARIVRRIDGYGPVADIVLSHHERWDGTGYPRGLKGTEIPLAARLISVADTYDVLTARDSYRHPVSSDEAIGELRRVAGHQLDPAAVEAFASLLSAKDISYRHADDAEFEAELAFEHRVRDYARPRA
jgi:putative nucleotidyltransferase with HDIG domain